MDKAERNAEICKYYSEGHTVPQCCLKFSLKRMRIQQILKKAGLWRPHEKSRRDKFLGVAVTTATKDALSKKATEEGVSVSKLTSDALDALVTK
jgi:hypothetical protein